MQNILEKLRRKYPQLQEEPLMDQLESELGPQEDLGAGSEDEMDLGAPEEDLGAPQDEEEFLDLGADTEEEEATEPADMHKPAAAKKKLKIPGGMFKK